MSNALVAFLRARYRERRAAEMAVTRTKPSELDFHEIEMTREPDGKLTVLVDGHPYPTDEYLALTTEPAPDPAVLADLDAKERIVEQFTMIELLERSNGDTAAIGAYVKMLSVLRLLAAPHADHPGYEEAWRP